MFYVLSNLILSKQYLILIINNIWDNVVVNYSNIELDFRPQVILINRLYG